MNIETVNIDHNLTTMGFIENFRDRVRSKIKGQVARTVMRGQQVSMEIYNSAHQKRMEKMSHRSTVISAEGKPPDRFAYLEGKFLDIQA